MNAPASRYNTRSTSAATSSQQSPINQSAPTQVAIPAPSQIKTPSTDPFLKDFTLVAEAAKRAQMAVMVRDFADCGL